MKIDEGFFLQKGTSRSVDVLTKVLLFSPFQQLREESAERSGILFLIYSLFLLVSSWSI